MPGQNGSTSRFDQAPNRKETRVAVKLYAPASFGTPGLTTDQHKRWTKQLANSDNPVCVANWAAQTSEATKQGLKDGSCESHNPAEESLANGLGPRALRVYEALHHSIRSGELQPGAQLPTIPLLAADFGVSPVTIRNVQTRLEEEGLI